MKLGNWIAVSAFLGVGIGAATSQGCTVTASTCQDSSCGGTGNPPGSNDAGAIVSSDSGAPVQDDSSVADTGSTPTDPCNSCLYSQCVGAYSDCVGNATCLAIYQCATVPSCAASGSCVQACYDGDGGNDLSAGQALYLALGDCDIAAKCPSSAACQVCNPTAAECAAYFDGGASSEDGGGAEDAGSATTCGGCQASNCSAQLTECAAGTQCAAYNQCVLGCSDSQCTDACSSTNSAGYMAAQALGTCTTSSCASVCN